jgi:hypothetical protein
MVEREESKRRLFSDRFVQDELALLNQYRDIFRDVMKQYLNQHVTLDVTNSFIPAAAAQTHNDDSTELSTTGGVICDFNLEAALESMPLQKFTIEQVENTLNLIQRYRVMPLQVSQHVLAMHPILHELRTGCLLSTYGSKYHV